MADSAIIVCGKRYALDTKVLTFDDEGGYSGYIPHRTDGTGHPYASHPAPGLEQRLTRYRRRRLMGSSDGISRLKHVVRQIVVHLDGCRDSRMCFDVLHNQRGLSVHFMVDNDGTIYQTLDLVHCAFHAGGVNEISVGIELCNRGDAARNPKFYAEPRPKVTCRIHDAQFLCYDFTPAQYEAMVHLCRVLTRVFEVPLQAPLDSASRPVWTKLDNYRAFRGFVGHYHLSTNKWDPGPWDFQRLLRAMGSQVSFPLSGPPNPRESPERRLVQLRQQRDAYFENSEQDVGVHFPVGPLGRSRLWHGGVHLKAPLDAPVRAVFRGRIVAGRFRSPCALGQCNFALLRHEVVLGAIPWTFFSLYYHLAWDNEDVSGGVARLPWLRRAVAGGAKPALEAGRPLLLREAVEAGELLGFVGEAGPAAEREPQIHFAVFSASEISALVDPGAWEVYDQGGTSRFCRDARILRKIDRPTGGVAPDGFLSRRELRNFFRFSPARSVFRRTVVRHRSEWTPGEWDKELVEAPDFAALPVSRRKRLVEQQVRPTLWWTPEVAQHAGLPADGLVYSYHPLGFVAWIAELMRKTHGLRAVGIESAERWEGKMAPKHLTVDSESGDHMTDADDFYSGEHGKKLTLEDLVNGYPDDLVR